MTDKVDNELRLQVVRKAVVVSGTVPPEWEDPDGLLALGPRLRRMLRTNPLSASDDDPTQIVALDGARVVGRAHVFAGELRVAGDAVPILWGADLRVSQQYRRRGIGARLVQHRQTLHHTVVVCGMTYAAQALYRRLGWTEFRLPRYFLITRSRKFVDHYAPAALAPLLAPCVDAGLRLRRALRLRRGRLRHLRVEHAAAMPADLDPLMMRPAAPVTPHRSAAWVNWLLNAGEPEEQAHQRLCTVRGRLDEPVGYFLIRKDNQPLFNERFRNVMLGSLKDWGVFDARQLDVPAIALLAVRELLAWDVDAIRICLHDAPTGRTLRKLGFTHRGDLTLVFKAVPPSPLVREEYQRQENWHITPAEGDHFFS